MTNTIMNNDSANDAEDRFISSEKEGFMAHRNSHSKNSESISSHGSSSNLNNIEIPTQVLSRSSSDKIKGKRKRSSNLGLTHTPASINYKGINIYQAAEQGSLPLCVLLWGMASSKRVNLIAPDIYGNNPLHMAAISESSEVIGFLLQQTRGYFNDEIKLVDSRNLLGETPLLKCMSTGAISVAKALLEEGSDPLVTDHQGNSIFTKLAKSGNIWCLNFMYHTICLKYGIQVAIELLSSLDTEGHSPLDWAADSGNINVIEFFVRKGLNPYRTDVMNRGLLYWSAKAARADAVHFLVSCGCNPDQKDTFNQSPKSIANFNHELLRSMSNFPKCLAEQNYTNIQIADSNRIPILYKKRGDLNRSHAIYRKNLPSIKVTLLFFVLFFSLWLLFVFFPFYVGIIFDLFIFLVYRRSKAIYSLSQGLLELELFFERPEKTLGFWISSMIVYGIVLLSTTFFYYGMIGLSSESLTAFNHVYGLNLFHIRGISGGKGASGLLVLSIIAYWTSVILWVVVVWIKTDPGIIDTRVDDFEDILSQSMLTSGPPSSSLHCFTTMVKKPLRGKYCSKTGAVVARMDHYCSWLNCSIGFGNHRYFLALVVSHLISATTGCALIINAFTIELKDELFCFQIATLLKRDYFLPLLLLFLLLITSICLIALLSDQLYNIASNLTTNEKINKTRYFWISERNGEIITRFNRGVILNVLEFFKMPGFEIDYTKIYDLPAELTQENVESISFTTNRLSSLRSHGLINGQESGPPSIDLEMTVIKNRADSVDSSDTSLSGQEI